jgi:hypothetical protein
MRRQNQTAAMFDHIANGRQRRLDARVIGNHAIANGNVEIDAHENTASAKLDI